jgi:hypothetical protein
MFIAMVVIYQIGFGSLIVAVSNGCLFTHFAKIINSNPFYQLGSFVSSLVTTL